MAVKKKTNSEQLNEANEQVQVLKAAENEAAANEADAPAAAEEETKKYHVWREKDNRLIISQEYKVTVEKLARLNPDIENWLRVKVGQSIRIK